MISIIISLIALTTAIILRAARALEAHDALAQEEARKAVRLAHRAWQDDFNCSIWCALRTVELREADGFKVEDACIEAWEAVKEADKSALSEEEADSLLAQLGW